MAREAACDGGGSRERYLMMQAIATTVLRVPGAVLHGGFVRDMVLHNTAARAFYLHPHVRSVLGRAGRDGVMQAYLDEDCLPSLAERRVVPVDVDCWMPSADGVRALAAGLRAMRFLVRQPLMAVPASVYVDGAPEQLRFSRLLVKVMLPKCVAHTVPGWVRALEVRVDLVHGGQSVTDLPPPDFWCNSLVLGADGALSTRGPCPAASPLARPKLLVQALDDVLKKRAVIVQRPAPSKRTRHMLNKGWTVCDGPVSTACSSAVESGTCLMCLGNFKAARWCTRRDCCAAVYHPTCYAKMVNYPGFSGACPMCRVPYGSERCIEQSRQ